MTGALWIEGICIYSSGR